MQMRLGADVQYSSRVEFRKDFGISTAEASRSDYYRNFRAHWVSGMIKMCFSVLSAFALHRCTECVFFPGIHFNC